MKKQYYKTREEWETLRNALIAEGRIGGSMVGTVAGVNPYQSPYTLWAEMTGRIPRLDISGREAVRLGHDLEDYVAKRFCELTGKQVHRENCIITNEDYPHLFASIDRKVSNEEAGLECKTANAYRDSAFADGEFPDGYYRQVKTYLAVTGLDRWYLAVLVMGVAFRVFLVTRRAEDLDNPPSWCAAVRYVDEMELADCEDDAATFIEGNVRGGVAPAMMGADDERGSVNAVNGGASSGTVQIGLAVDALIARRASLKRQGDATKEEVAAVENEIIAALGGAAEGRSASWKVTYKWSDTRRLDKDAVAKALGGTIPDSCYKVTNSATLRITPVKAR